MPSWVWLTMECWAGGLVGWAMDGVEGLDVPARSQCVCGFLRGLWQTEGVDKGKHQHQHHPSTARQLFRLVWPGLSYLTKLGAGYGATVVLHIASSCSHRSLVRKPAGCFDPGHGSLAVVGGVYPAMPPDLPLWETCIGQRHVPAAILGQAQLSALMKPPSALWRSAAPFRSPASVVSPSRLWRLAALASFSAARGTPRRFTLQSSDDCVGISRPGAGQPSLLGEMIELSTSNISPPVALKDESDLIDSLVCGLLLGLGNRGHALGLAYRRGPGGPKNKGVAINARIKCRGMGS
ncbi:hypothetical protein F5144DRAFT_594418 [Chaetomium tenue]|uniref:Uncharacterized protein n=1 Tax=Chaetomium tenue TaxID=1854479 RepID=A0ACB7P595_9PEZI|nr:hypothetical protein F5144DRAFT_594418 [Chaetomium globosum]